MKKDKDKDEGEVLIEINVDKNIIYASQDLTTRKKDQQSNNPKLYDEALGELKYFRRIESNQYNYGYQIEYFNNSSFILSSFVFEEVKYINFANLVNGYLSEEEGKYYLILKYYDRKVFDYDEESIEYIRFEKMEEGFINNPYFIENIDHYPFVSYKFLIDERYRKDILLMERGRFYDIVDKSKNLILSFCSPYTSICNKYKIIFYNQTKSEKLRRQKLINDIKISLGYEEEDDIINNESSLIQPLKEELWELPVFNNPSTKKKKSSKLVRI